MVTRIGLARCLCSVLLVFLCGGSGQPGLVKLPATSHDGIRLDRVESPPDAPVAASNQSEQTDQDDLEAIDAADADEGSTSDLGAPNTPNDALRGSGFQPKSAAGRANPRKVRRICRVTAYCDRGLTASGVPSGVGQCAAPGDIPLGSVVYIPELKKHFVVTDRTHRRFRHNTVDLFIPNESDCIKFGRKYLTCEFVIPENPPAYGKLNLAAARRAAIAVD